MRRLTLTAQFGILSAVVMTALGFALSADLVDAVTLGIVYLVQIVFVASASRKLRIQVEENEYQALHDTLTAFPTGRSSATASSRRFFRRAARTLASRC